MNLVVSFKSPCNSSLKNEQEKLTKQAERPAKGLVSVNGRVPRWAALGM